MAYGFQHRDVIIEKASESVRSENCARRIDFNRDANLCLKRAKEEKQSLEEVDTQHLRYLELQDALYIGNINDVDRISLFCVLTEEL